MDSNPGKPVLGLVISRGDRIIKRLIPERDEVTIGQSPDCDIVLQHDSSVPQKHVMAVRRGEDYEFCINEQMDGKISVGDSTISLRDLRTCGFLGRRSQGYTFTVTKSKKGQIRVANITIHFGYFTPSTQQVLGEPRLADAVTSGGFLDPDQKVFTGFLVGSLLLAGAYGYLTTFAVHDPTTALDNLPPSLEKLLVSEDAAPLNIGDAGGDGEGEVVEEVAVEATSEGTGTGGGGGGGSSDVVSEGQAMGSGAAEFAIASIMSNVVGGAGGSTGIAMGAGTAALMSTGVGTVGAGGGGAGAGGTGEGDGFASAAGGSGGPGISRTEAGSGGGPTVTKARAVAPTASVSSSSSDVSSDAISKISNYIRARGGQIKRIYERYLADNPMLAGRVVVNVTFTNGSVSSASIAGNTTGNGALANEILSTVRGWSIGGIEGTVSLSVPFVLQPS